MTPVIFRKFRDGSDIVALFPTLPGDSSLATCLSYQHIGQHGAASVALIYETLPVSPGEYWPLLKELKRQGYDDLRIYTRYQPDFTNQRAEELNRERK